MEDARGGRLCESEGLWYAINRRFIVTGACFHSRNRIRAGAFLPTKKSRVCTRRP